MSEGVLTGEIENAAARRRLEIEHEALRAGLERMRQLLRLGSVRTHPLRAQPFPEHSWFRP